MAEQPTIELADPIHAYLKQFIKKDDELLEQLLITCFSSHTNDPNNLFIKGPSSSGKTHAAVTVTGIFPNVYTYSGQTDKAFVYDVGKRIDPETGDDVEPLMDQLRADIASLKEGRTRDNREEVDREVASKREQLREIDEKAMYLVDFRHKILVFLEPPNFSFWKAFQPLLSHDKKETIYQSVEKRGQGKLRAMKVLLRGWPACIMASAKNEEKWSIWPEIHSRFVMASPNVTSEKMKEANLLTAKLKGLPKFALDEIFPPDYERAARDAARAIFQDIERLYLASGVSWDEGTGNITFNPFYEQLAAEFPVNSEERMRQVKYLMRYVNLLALINGADRPRVVREAKSRAVVCSLADVQEAFALVRSSIESEAPKYLVDFYVSWVVPCYESNVVTRPGGAEAFEPVTARQVRRFCADRKKEIAADTVRRYLKSLAVLGLVEVDESNRFKPAEDAVKNRELDVFRSISPQTVVESLKSLRTAYGNKVVNYQYPDGEFVEDLEEMAARLMEGVELPTVQSALVQEPVPDSRDPGDVPPSPVAIDPAKEATETAAAQGAPDGPGAGSVPRAHLVVKKCSVCGKDLDFGAQYFIKGKGDLCRDHFLAQKKGEREETSE
jgi:hypothetical protein